MRYNEMLKEIMDENVSGADFYIAEEMNCQLVDVQEVEVTQDRYESLCGLAHELWLKAEGISLLQICRAVAELQKGFIEGDNGDPLKISKWDLLDVAANCEY